MTTLDIRSIFENMAEGLCTDDEHVDFYLIHLLGHLPDPDVEFLKAAYEIHSIPGVTFLDVAGLQDCTYGKLIYMKQEMHEGHKKYVEEKGWDAQAPLFQQRNKAPFVCSIGDLAKLLQWGDENG